MVIVTIDSIEGKKDYEEFDTMVLAKIWIEQQLSFGYTTSEFKIHEVLITYLPEIDIKYNIYGGKT